MLLQPDASHAGQRLDHYLQQQLPQYSRARLQGWIKEGRVRVDGQAAKASAALKGRERIDVEPGELPPLKATPEEIPLSILYEDAAVVAVDKPPGLVVHAGAGRHTGTLVNALLHRFSTLSQLGGDLRPGIVHRLDRETSGVLLVAKHDEAHRDLASQFAHRRVEKIYLTLVHGRVERNSGEITLPITRDPIRRTRMTATLAQGREAYTRYTVLRRWPTFTYLRVLIGTGRTHQIRVHLSTVGHPVVGDVLYGAPRSVPGLPAPPRTFLHAHQITFRSPATQAATTVVSPLPADLESYLAELPSP